MAITLSLLSHPDGVIPLGEKISCVVEGLTENSTYSVYHHVQNILYPAALFENRSTPEFTFFPEARGEYRIRVQITSPLAEDEWVEQSFKVGDNETEDHQPSLMTSLDGDSVWTSSPWEAAFFKAHEFTQTQKLLQLLQEGDVVYELGANLGHHAVQLGKAVGPSGSVYCFEANPIMLYFLNANLIKNKIPQATVFPLAVSDGSKNLEFKINLFNSLIGVAEDSSNYMSKPGMNVSVPAMALDDVIDQFRLRAPDAIKIDIEGAEASALQGMKHTLQTHKPIVFMEVHSRQAAEDSFAILDGFGYTYRDTDTGETYLSKADLLSAYQNTICHYSCFPGTH